MPLELFVFVGSFLEEAVSPIPSFVVLLPAGAVAQLQGTSWWYLPVLGLVAACGRIIAAVALYLLAAKAEGALLGKGRRVFGVSHEQIRAFGKRFNGKARDWWVLFLLNAVPVLPTSFLSVACGFIKIPFRMFVLMSFFGSIVNAMCYLALGYAGIEAANDLRGADTVLQAVLAFGLAALLLWLVYRRRKNKRAVSAK